MDAKIKVLQGQAIVNTYRATCAETRPDKELTDNLVSDVKALGYKDIDELKKDADSLIIADVKALALSSGKMAPTGCVNNHKSIVDCINLHPDMPVSALRRLAVNHPTLVKLIDERWR